MLIGIFVGCVLVILIILFYPRRSPYVRRVTKSYNGRQHGKERELY
jgi:hypothetical protein